MRRALQLVIGCLPTAVTVGGGVFVVTALAAFTAITALGRPHTASGAESPRGLHVISTGAIEPTAVVLDDDGTPWFTSSKFAIHVTAEGRVVKYRLPKSGQTDTVFIAWGADGALWAVDEDIGGLIRMTPDGHSTRFRDVWATPETLGETGPPSIIAGPDGRIWLGDRARHRIVSIAADGSIHVVARLAGPDGPWLLATGPDGSVWFSHINDDTTDLTGLQRVLPDGRIEATRYPNSEIASASVAPNGDVWFSRSKSSQTVIKRTDVVRIDRTGRVTEFRAPRIAATWITVAADGTVWIDGQDGAGLARGDIAEVLARMDGNGRFERIFRAPPWFVDDVRPAPDGRLWMVFEKGYGRTFAAWLPPDPCLSRRRISLHPHSRRGDPIRTVRVLVQGRLPRTVHGREPTIRIDLRGFLPGAVGVTLKVRTVHHRYTRHRLYHTCTSSG